MNQRFFRAVALVCLAAAVLASGVRAEDWPAYKRDAARSSVTAEALSLPLAQQWVFEPIQAPRPAWPEPGKELNRTDFDYAFQPVMAEGLVYFGSSADDTVRALDAATGELVWRFTTGGPVRFAPAVARGKAYVASDDGFLYCLNPRTGELVWRFSPEADRDRVIGNDRLIARYPCRTGALVLDNVVYVTVGMWPTERVCVAALDADTGKELWCNDSSGNIYVDLPHAVANGFSGVAPQGYLVCSGDVLLVPTGRSVPAAFDRHTGRLLHYKPEKTHYHGASYGGGVWCTAAGDLYFNTRNRSQNPSEAFLGEAEPSRQDGMIVYPAATGDQLGHLPGKYRVLVASDVVYAAGNGSIEAIKLSAVRRGKGIGSKDTRWTTPHPGRVYCLAMAGQTLFAGNRDRIAAYSASDGKPVWGVDVKGEQVRGMAVADGRLLAAMHTGTLRCFAPARDATAAPKRVKEEPRLLPISAEFKERAGRVVEQSGKREGYALIIGEPDGRLAEALARHSRLHVVGLLENSDQVARERERLLDAGLLGSRVALHAVEDPADVALPSYFADLVVVSPAAAGVLPRECYRTCRPCGGRLCLLGFDEARKWEFARRAEIPAAEIDRSVVTRGELPGAGEWRYPWADGGRRGIGNESLVRFPMQLLWFGGPGPGRMMDRHLMGSPPISTGGRVFLQGQHDVLAFDAYNGRELWSRPIREVGREYSQYYSSSLVADAQSVYVVADSKCFRLDQATGETVATYAVPEPVVDQTAPPNVPDYMDVEWPRAWQVLGPFPKGKPPLSTKTLRTLPDRVTVGGEEYVTSELEAASGTIDFTTLFGGYDLKPLSPGEKPAVHPRRGKQFSYHDVGRIAYAAATIDCPRSGTLLVGAGADWGMLWFLDGEPVFNALRSDSSSARRGFYSRTPCSPTDRLFDLEVTAGKHVLAVMVTAGSRGWALASASLAGRVEEVMPVSQGENPNVPNLKDLDWGYLSVTDDLLLGSYNVPVAAGQPAESHLLWRSESKALFALDKKDGSLRWVYRPEGDRIVANIEIAFGDGRLFLIDGTSKADLVRAKRRNTKIAPELALVALDLVDGRELWRQRDVPLLGDRGALSRLKTNISHLFMGQPSWGHLVYADGVVLYGANAAYDAANGEKLWQKSTSPGKLPVVYGDRVITSNTAYDLRTGEQCTTEDALTGESVPWRYLRAYGCGPVSGCENVLFFRSGASGFFDMETEGLTNYGGVRAGCARTLLAAGGLLIHPQGYSGCGCSYNYKTNLALIAAPDRGDAWYVFPRRADSGLIRRVAVNFGAPGDRRDLQKAPWLGFPRPMLESACPASVVVSMSRAACQYRRRATDAIQKTDVPWLYSSALVGQGRIAVDLRLRPGVPLPSCDAAPKVDGKLDDACWDAVYSVPFESSAFSMLAACVDLRIFRDDENIYFAYHRKPLENARADAEAATLEKSDQFDVYLADAGKKVGIRFVIGRSGKATATFGTLGVSRKTDPGWKGEWRHAVNQVPGGWTAELAVPIKTLVASGMSAGRLQLNAMSQNLTQSGLEGVFLTDPYYSVKFQCCSRFLRVVGPSDKAPKERSFTVRLHFAEIDDVKAGDRVFDVAVQGKRVLEDFDVVKEAGGRHVALVREFTGVKASDRVLIEFESTAQGIDGYLPPMLSAVEVVQEEE